MATEYGQGYGSPSGPGFHQAGAEERRHRLPAPLRAPIRRRSWREFGYVMSGLPVGILMFTFAVTMFSLGMGLLITFLGIPVLAAALAGVRGFGALERARARGLLGIDVAAPEPLRVRKQGALAWMGAPEERFGVAASAVLGGAVPVVGVLVRGGAELLGVRLGDAEDPLWFWLFPVYGGQGGLQLYGDGMHRIYLDNPFEITVTALLGLLITMATPWIVRALTMVDRVMVAGLLGPRRGWRAGWSSLESDRGVVVDTAAADLRRIERDLHDGAQARLVNLAMGLGLAKEKLTEDPQAAARMVDEAHGEVKTALQELRDLARGIPSGRADRSGAGCGAVLRGLARHAGAGGCGSSGSAGAGRLRGSRTSPSPSCCRTSASMRGRRGPRSMCGGSRTG